MASILDRTSESERPPRAEAAPGIGVAGRCFVVAAIALVTFYSALNADRLFFVDPTYANWLVFRDVIDVPIILRSIRAHPTFLSTLSWWHSSWTVEVPFWRPLTILVFWVEYHLFALKFQYWIVLSLVAHFVCVGLFGRVAYLLTRRFDVAALSVFLFVFVRTSPENHVTELLDSIMLWKNQPEIFVGICILGAMICTMRGRWWGALAFAVVAVCFKEEGWAAFIIILGLLVRDGKLSQVPVRVYAATFASVAVLVWLRWLSGPAVFVGYHIGSNTHWIARYGYGVQGYYLDEAQHNYGLAIVSLCTALAVGVRRIRWGLLARVLLVVGAFGLAAAVNALDRQSGFTVCLVALIDVVTWSPVFVYLVLLLVCYMRLVSDALLCGPALIALLIAALLAVPMALASQVQVHVLYLACAFQGIVVASALIAAYRSLVPARFTIGAFLPRAWQRDPP